MTSRENLRPCGVAQSKALRAGRARTRLVKPTPLARASWFQLASIKDVTHDRGCATRSKQSHAPTRTSAKATIRTRTGGLPPTGVATNERGRADQRHLGPLAHDGRSDGRDLHRRRRRRPRVSIQIGGQRSPDCALGLPGGRSLRVHGQPSHVSAEHARILTFDDNWKMRCHYTTPASRKIRLPSLPAS
jgi:hypothetical protein